MTRVCFELNGESVSADVEPRLTLAVHQAHVGKDRNAYRMRARGLWRVHGDRRR